MIIAKIKNEKQKQLDKKVVNRNVVITTYIKSNLIRRNNNRVTLKQQLDKNKISVML